MTNTERTVKIIWRDGTEKTYECNDARHAANLISKFRARIQRAVVLYGWEDKPEAGLWFTETLSRREFDTRLASLRGRI